MTKEIIKFVVTGFLGTVINLVIFYLLVEKAGMLYIFGAAISFVVAITNNFFWNKHWTFKNKSQKYKEQYIKYFFVSILGLGINLIILSILIEIFNLWYMFAQLIAIILTGVSNFLLNKNWTFKHQ